MPLVPLRVTVLTTPRGGAAVFGGEVRRHHLEFLDRILRDLRGDAGAARVLVEKLLGVIDAVHQE